MQVGVDCLWVCVFLFLCACVWMCVCVRMSRPNVELVESCTPHKAFIPQVRWSSNPNKKMKSNHQTETYLKTFPWIWLAVRILKSSCHSFLQQIELKWTDSYRFQWYWTEIAFLLFLLLFILILGAFPSTQRKKKMEPADELCWPHVVKVAGSSYTDRPWDSRPPVFQLPFPLCCVILCSPSALRRQKDRKGSWENTKHLNVDSPFWGKDRRGGKEPEYVALTDSARVCGR